MKVALAGVLALVCIGCVQMTVPGATMTEDGCVMFSADGQAVAAKEDDALAGAEARLAAAVVAKANLLEKIKGAMVTSSASVGDLMFRSQEAELEVAGFLSRATVTYAAAPDTRLGTSPVVTATASLVLTPEELASLEKYVE
jgi:hypothetical protein